MLGCIDSILRREGTHATGRTRVPWAELVAVTGLCCFLYGTVMGSHGTRALQVFYSGLKVPFLLAVATIVCLPSFYVANAVLGLRHDFSAACRGILASQATLAITLAGLAPVTLVAYISGMTYPLPNVVNGLQFAIATWAAHTMLGHHYTVLERANSRHRLARQLWVVVYVFVAIQMAWVLRPFIGNPEMPVEFFRDDAWSNAYVEVARMLWRVVHG